MLTDWGSQTVSGPLSGCDGNAEGWYSGTLCLTALRYLSLAISIGDTLDTYYGYLASELQGLGWAESVLSQYKHKVKAQGISTSIP